MTTTMAYLFSLPVHAAEKEREGGRVQSNFFFRPTTKKKKQSMHIRLRQGWGMRERFGFLFWLTTDQEPMHGPEDGGGAETWLWERQRDNLERAIVPCINI